MNHPSILKVAAVTLTPPALFMVEVNKNSLAQSLKEPIIYVPHHLLEIFEGVACSLSYLHERMHLSHCDLHLGNILIEENDEGLSSIITDFEFSSAKNASMATKGNRYIKAPETLVAHPEIRSTLLRYQGTKRRAALANQGPLAHQRELQEQSQLWELLNKNISEKNDIWAFATSLYATIGCGKGPYEIDPVKERNLLKSSLKLQRPELMRVQLRRCLSRQRALGSPLHYNHPLVIDLMQNVMLRCFQIDPDLRPFATELHI